MTAARFFDGWVQLMLRRRFAVLALVGLITAGFGWSLLSLPLLTSITDILPRDANWQFYQQARQRFGGDEMVLVALQADDHFTVDGLKRLEGLASAIEEHPLVEEVLGFTRADRIHVDPAEPDRLIIEPFYDPDEPADPQAVRAAVLGDDLVVGDLVSADGKMALITVTLVPSEDDTWDREEVAAFVGPRLAQQPGGAGQLKFPGGKARAIEVAKQMMGYELNTLGTHAGFEKSQIFMSGFPVIFGSLLVESQQVIKTYFPICIALICGALFLLFRRGLDVALPLVCMAPAVIWAIGVGGMLFGRLTIITSVAPIMVLVVGMSDVVHLLTQFHHEQGRGLERDQAIRVAFREVGAACTLTSLTTLIGFGSMALLPLPHARELGTFAALGVVTAFLLSFVLTPILLSFTTPRAQDTRPPAGALTRILDWTARMVRPRPKVVMAVGLAVTGLTLFGAAQIEVENSLLLKLPEAHPLRVAAEVVRDAVGGNGEAELIIDTGRADGLKDPAMLAAIHRFEQALAAMPDAGRVRSVTDVFGRMHGLLAPELAAKAPMPSTSAQIAQYLLLFEMSGGQDLDQLLDPSRRFVRVLVRTPYQTAEEGIAHADEIQAMAKTMLPAGAQAQVTGVALLAARAGPVILRTSLRGLATAMGLIAILMALLFRSVRVGLLSIVPNLMPVAFGILMVWLFLPQVDADAMVYLTICIGIAVDDTIHFLTRYRLERGRGLERADAVGATIRETGHGIARTSLILVAGFAVTLSSDYLGLQTLGVMLPATLASAMVLDMTLVPAMVQLGWLEPKVLETDRSPPPSV